MSNEQSASKSPALADALEYLEEHGITDAQHPETGNMGQEIRAIIGEIIERVEAGERPAIGELTTWVKRYGEGKARVMLTALQEACAYHADIVEALSDVITVAGYEVATAHTPGENRP